MTDLVVRKLSAYSVKSLTARFDEHISTRTADLVSKQFSV